MNMSSPKAKPRIGLIVIALILTAISAMLAAMIAEAKNLYSFAFIVAISVLLPAAVIALFQFGSRFRNFNSGLKIYCWTSLVIVGWQFLWIASLLPKDY